MGSTAGELAVVRENPDEVFRRLEQGRCVESNNSQVLRLMPLRARMRTICPSLVNAAKKAFLKSYVEDDRRAKRSRLAELDKSYKERLKKELAKSRKELQAANV